jgi:hypothetical protein
MRLMVSRRMTPKEYTSDLVDAVGSANDSSGVRYPLDISIQYTCKKCLLSCIIQNILI